MKRQQWEEVLDVDLTGPVLISHMLLPAMLESGWGRIINISSISGLFNSPFNGTYSIAKHALESMTDVYRRELRRYKIKVIAIEPGPIKTEIWKKNLNSMAPFAETDYNDVLKKANAMIENAERNRTACSTYFKSAAQMH